MYCWLRSAGFCTKLWLLCNLFNSAKVLVCSQSHVYFCNVCRCGHFCVFGQSSKNYTFFWWHWHCHCCHWHCHWLSLTVTDFRLGLDLWLVSWLDLTRPRVLTCFDSHRLTETESDTRHETSDSDSVSGTARWHCPPALPTGTAHRHCPLSLTLYIPYSP